MEITSLFIKYKRYRIYSLKGNVLYVSKLNKNNKYNQKSNQIKSVFHF